MLRLLTRVAAISATIGVGSATAQTLIVTDAHPGTTVESQLNAAAATTVPVDATGNARLAVGLPAGTNESDVHVFVDTCDMRVRVQFVSPGLQPAPSAAGCVRHDITGVFVMRRATTFVVSLEGPALHLTQGPAPAEWFTHGGAPVGPWRSPRGLLLFGGAGITNFSNAGTAACGNVTSCSGDNLLRTVAAGAALWITPFLGAEFTYARPAQSTTTGTGTGFHFSGTRTANVLTVAGTVGIPIGRVRLYGLGGANYHQATSVTTETIDDVTVVVNGVTQTITGGTQTLEHKTEGWNWLVGGGLEAWATKSIALYAEAQHARLKATDIGSDEGGIDEHLTFIVAGARIRLGR